MLAAIFITGLLLGVVITTVIIYSYNAALEMHEEEVRQRLEEKRRQANMRQKQRKEGPQDPLEKKILEETDAAIQRREEG